MPRQPRRPPNHDLVSFVHPPVAEVALSVQFRPDTVDLEVLGRFAREVRHELPMRERQPVAPPMLETFDKVAPIPAFEIRVDVPTALPRTWFLSEDGVQLVQLQHDRLSLNWRELDKGIDYPRYDQLRERFVDLLDRLVAGLEEVGVSPAVNLCEVTYVNPIEYRGRSARGDRHPDLAKIINRLRARPRGAFLPDAEDAQLNARWRIPAEELGHAGPAPAGRLYLSASPGLKPPGNAPIYVVNLSARVIPSGGEADPDSAMSALDVGHKWVVLGFKDLTTPEMHRQWGLEETT